MPRDDANVVRFNRDSSSESPEPCRHDSWMHRGIAAGASLAVTIGLDHALVSLAGGVRRARGGRDFVVLSYHRVGGSDDLFFPGVSRREFASHCAELGANWNVLPLSELVGRCNDRTLPPRAVGICFDDSYRSVYEIALPLLQRHGLSATIFAPTQPLHDGKPLWYDRVSHAIRSTDRQRLRLSVADFEDRSIAEPRARYQVALDALEALKRLREGERDAMVVELEALLSPAEWRSNPALANGDLTMLREAANQGFEIGAHTVTHPILSRLTRYRQRTELRDSKRDLEAWLQREINAFAYPNGGADDYTPTTVEEV